MLVQGVEDLSDRELENHLKDSLSAKLFCGFSLSDTTPDHSYFGKLRDRIGTRRLAKLFSAVRMPFEGTFAHLSKRARYKGVVKVQFQAVLQALAFNFARLLKINAPPLVLNSS